MKTCEEQVFTGAQKAEFRVQQGLAIARLTGDFEQAKDKFKQGQELDRGFYQSLDYDPEMKAKKIRASVLLSEGEKAGQEGELEGAVAKF